MYNYLLIPGAWLGGWVWRDVQPRIEEKGHRVFPITLTGMGDRVHLASPEFGIETAVQDVLNVVSFNDLNNIVLVGHSFAGKVAAVVADRITDKIKQVIYLDSFRPDDTTEPQGSFTPDEFGPIPERSFSIPFSKAILQKIGKDVTGKNL
jgi:pimeloyl-ACP methyl ester carboxylesterase